MSKNDSEERSLPASKKKLREARERGQVPRSTDAVIGATTLAAVLYLWFQWDGIVDRLLQIIDLSAESIDKPFDQAAALAAQQSIGTIIEIVLPILILVFAISLLTSLVSMGGFVFSMEPVVPKMEKLNPIEGFKRVFGLRNLVEFIKAVVKATLVGLAAIGLIALGMQSLLQAPSCGVACVAASFVDLLFPIIILIAILFVCFALIDLLIQQWLFMRDQRMTKTELKQERRDIEGDPMIRKERRRTRKEMTQGRGTTGIENATLVISDGGGIAVALRYVRGETPVPLIVARGRSDSGRELLRQAGRLDKPISVNPELATRLVRGVPLGGNIPRDMFQRVAEVLIRARAI